MKIATVGVHVLDTHVTGIESIPPGSDGQLVESIRFSPAGTAGGTAVVLARLGAEVHTFGAVGEDPIAASLLAMLEREGVDVTGLVRKAEQTSSSVSARGVPSALARWWSVASHSSSTACSTACARVAPTATEPWLAISAACRPASAVRTKPASSGVPKVA